jgi:hypothetical protein
LSIKHRFERVEEEDDEEADVGPNRNRSPSIVNAVGKQILFSLS